nr:putative MO25-like protein At5g47540 [Ipomoea trifida]
MDNNGLMYSISWKIKYWVLLEDQAKLTVALKSQIYPRVCVMTRYVSSRDNLRILMNLLRESSKSIQIEAFHVFKYCFSDVQ